MQLKSGLISITCKSIFLAISIAQITTYAAPHEFDLLHPEAAQGALSVLRDEGFEAYLKYWRASPEKALNLRSWCQQQKAANGGNVVFEFATHENGVDVIDALNVVNAEMGFDCYKVSAKVDNAQIKNPTKPSLADAKSYERVRKWRSALIPMIGYLITAGPVLSSVTGDPSWATLTSHGSEFMMANMKGFLEFQFAYFSAMWSIPFGQKHFPELRYQAASYFQRSIQTLARPFAMLTSSLNKLMNKSGNTIRASHFWISAVNLVGYPFMMGTAAYLGHHLIGPGESAGFFNSLGKSLTAGTEMISQQFRMSLAFNFTFMLFQERASTARNQYLWNEKTRLVAESALAFVCNTLRGISAIYGDLETPMVLSQLLVGGSLSSLMIAKVRGAKVYAAETGRLLSDLELKLNPGEQKFFTDATKLAELASNSNSSVLQKAEIKILSESLESSSTLSTVGRFILTPCEWALGFANKIAGRVFGAMTWGTRTDALKPIDK